MTTDRLCEANDLDWRLSRLKGQISRIKSEYSTIEVCLQNDNGRSGYSIKGLLCYDEIRRMITAELESTCEKLEKQFEEL